MARRFWKTQPDFDYCGVYRKPPLQIEEVWELGRTRGRKRFDLIWNPDQPKAPRADFPVGAHGLLMSSRAANLLLPIIGEWACVQDDVVVGHDSFVMAIPTEIYDAMDEANSVGDRIGPSGLWFSVDKLVLLESRIGPAPFFRLPNKGIAQRFIISEPVMRAIEAAGLTGMTFHEAVLR